jgi:tRNA-2-methylthio-N6-dimethylallyladenosine synthase
MKRGYTVEDYRAMMERIRQILPQAAVSSDFIVGFCGETDEEFAASAALLRECRFKNSFIFKYSERPGTKAAEHLPDDVPEHVKKERNNELLAMQTAISEEDNQAFVGRTVDVLVEGPSKKADAAGNDGIVQLTGRAHDDRIVVFDGHTRLVGEILPIGIYDCTAFTLMGTVLTREVSPDQLLSLGAN